MPRGIHANLLDPDPFGSTWGSDHLATDIRGGAPPEKFSGAAGDDGDNSGGCAVQVREQDVRTSCLGGGVVFPVDVSLGFANGLLHLSNRHHPRLPLAVDQLNVAVRLTREHCEGLRWWRGRKRGRRWSWSGGWRGRRGAARGSGRGNEEGSRCGWCRWPRRRRGC